MAWLVILSSYLLGSIPTAYFAGQLLRRRDIRRMGDGNMGAANVFREIGAVPGIAVGLLDAAKGALALLIARHIDASLPVILLAGTAAVFGHIFPIFLGFRGGRGESTTIGELLTLIPQPMLIVAVPAILTLLIRRNVVLASAVLFIPLPLLGWWLNVPGILVAYSLGLACIVGLTHFLRTRTAAVRQD